MDSELLNDVAHHENIWQHECYEALYSLFSSPSDKISISPKNEALGLVTREDKANMVMHHTKQTNPPITKVYMEYRGIVN